MITNLVDGFIWNSNVYATNWRVGELLIFTNQLSSNDVASVYAYLTRIPEHWWQTPIPAYWLFVVMGTTAFAIWLGIWCSTEKHPK